MLQVAFTAAATATFSGPLGQAVAASDDAMELIERRPGLLTTAPVSLMVVGQRAIVLQYNGRLDEAEELSSRVLEAARLAGQVEIEGLANSWRAYAHLARGHSQDALRHVRRALEIAEHLGSPFSRAIARLSCALVGSFLALWPETERWGQEGVAIIREHHVGMVFEPFLLTCWAEALAAGGEQERAQDIIEEAIAKAQSFGRGILEVRAHLGQARILLCASVSLNTEAIAAALQAAETLARAIDCATWLPWVYEERAALARLRGDESERRGRRGGACTTRSAQVATCNESRAGSSRGHEAVITARTR
jgi:tetratricopeptide (TPR) repeat protein